MAIQKEFFGYALQSVDSNTIIRILNVSDLAPVMRKYIRENSQFKSAYSDNLSMLIFNSLFNSNEELTCWLINVLKTRGVNDSRLDGTIETKLYYATDEKIVNRERLNGYFSKLINAKKNYYELPFIYSYQLKQCEEDKSHVLTQRDLINPFFAQLKLASGIKINTDDAKRTMKSKEEIINNKSAELYDVYEAAKLLSSKSISSIKDSLLILLPYISLNHSTINDFNISEFNEKLSEFNKLVLSFSESTTPEKLTKLNQFRKYIYEIIKRINFNKLYKVSDNSEFDELFNKIFTSYEKKFNQFTQNEEDIDKSKYNTLSKYEKLDTMISYFKNKRVKGELDYKVSPDDPKNIIKLAKYLSEYEIIKNSDMLPEQTRKRTR